MNKVRFQFQLPECLVKKIDKQAKINYQNRTQLIVQCIVQYINELEISEK